MRTTIPTGTWFGIGFGYAMPMSDFIIWHANEKNDSRKPDAGDY